MPTPWMCRQSRTALLESTSVLRRFTHVQQGVRLAGSRLQNRNGPRRASWARTAKSIIQGHAMNLAKIAMKHTRHPSALPPLRACSSLSSSAPALLHALVPSTQEYWDHLARATHACLLTPTPKQVEAGTGCCGQQYLSCIVRHQTSH